MNKPGLPDCECFGHTGNQLLYPVVGLAGILVVLTVLASLRQPLGPWLPAVVAFTVGGGVWVLSAPTQLRVWWLLAAIGVLVRF